MKAKIVYQSPRKDTYVDVIAAIAESYPEIKEICIVFFDRPTNEESLNDIQKKLSDLSDLPSYSRGARLRLSAEEHLLDSKELLKDCFLMDITAVSKETAVSIAAGGIERQHILICYLKWRKKIEEGHNLRIGIDEYLYVNLFTEGTMKVIRKNYFSAKLFLSVLIVMLSLIFGAFLAKFIWPYFFIPDDIINFSSLLMGAAGLYLAAVSFREK